jgi:hypothetical protein
MGVLIGVSGIIKERSFAQLIGNQQLCFLGFIDVSIPNPLHILTT